MTISNGLLEAHELAAAGHAEADPLPIALIDPNPANPRKLLEIAALAESIRSFGLLQAVLVRPNGERFELVAGHRRYAAYRLLAEHEPLEPRWRAIPAAIKTMDDDTATLALISAQVHSRAWKPREEAAALEQLVMAGRNLSQVGEAINRSVPWVSRRLRVYADAVLSGYVQTGVLPAVVAEELLPVLDPAVRREFADQAAAEGWSKEQARARVRGLRLSTQLPDLARRVQGLIDLLEPMQPEAIPLSIARNLWTLDGIIQRLSGKPTTLPTIEQAERAAGVTEAAKARAEAKRVAARRQTRKTRQSR